MSTRDDEILERLRSRRRTARPPSPEGLGMRALRFARGTVKGAIDAPLALLEGAGKLGTRLDRAIGAETTEEETGAATRGIARLRELNRRFFEQGGTTGADTVGQVAGSLVGFGGAYRQAGKALSGALTSARVARAAQGTGRAARAARGAQRLGNTNRFWPSRLREGIAGAPMTIAMDAPEQEGSTAYALGAAMEGGDEWNDPIAESLIEASETMPGRIATGVAFDMLGDVAVSKGIDAFQARRAKSKARKNPRLADVEEEAEEIAAVTPSPTVARSAELEKQAAEAEARAEELENKASPGRAKKKAREALRAQAEEARSQAEKLRAEAKEAADQAEAEAGREAPRPKRDAIAAASQFPNMVDLPPADRIASPIMRLGDQFGAVDQTGGPAIDPNPLDLRTERERRLEQARRMIEGEETPPEGVYGLTGNEPPGRGPQPLLPPQVRMDRTGRAETEDPMAAERLRGAAWSGMGGGDPLADAARNAPLPEDPILRAAQGREEVPAPLIEPGSALRPRQASAGALSEDEIEQMFRAGLEEQAPAGPSTGLLSRRNPVTSGARPARTTFAPPAEEAAPALARNQDLSPVVDDVRYEGAPVTSEADEFNRALDFSYLEEAPVLNRGLALPGTRAADEVAPGATETPELGDATPPGENVAPAPATADLATAPVGSQIQLSDRIFIRTKKGFREAAQQGTGMKGRTLSLDDMRILEREASDPAYRAHRARAAAINDPLVLIEAARRIARQGEKATTETAKRLLARESQAYLDEIDMRGLDSRLGAADMRLLAGIARAGMGAVLGAAADPEDPISGALAGAAVAAGLPGISRLTRGVAEAATRSNSLYANPLLDPDLYLNARQRAVRDYLLPQEAMSTGRFGFAVDAVRNLDPEKQAQFTREVEASLVDEDTGEDLVWRAIGGDPGAVQRSAGEGMYMGDITPNMIHRVAESASDDLIARYSAMKGLLMGQDAMVWSRQVMEGTEGSAPGYVLSAGDPLPSETYREMQQIINSEERFSPLGGSTFAEGHVLFRNFDESVPEATYRSLLDDLIERVQTVPEIMVGEGHFIGAYYDGPADYLRTIGRDADSIQRTHDLLVERTAPVFQRWVAAAGGDAGATRARIEESARALEAAAKGLRHAPDLTKIQGQGGRTNLEVATEIRARNPDIYDLPWEEQRPRLLRLGMEDLRQARQELAQGGDWYEGSLQDAYALLPFKIPETRDPDQRSIFSMILAITSNNADVNPNWARAVGIYDQFRKTGEITIFDATHPQADLMRLTNAERMQLVAEGKIEADPGKVYAGGTMGSDKDWTIDKGLRKLDALVKDRGAAGMRDFLVSPHRKGVRGFGGYQIPQAANLFGEKVGAFMSNVEGVSEYVTTDKWMKRTWDGWMGRVHTTPRMFPVKGQKGKYETRTDPETGEVILDLNDEVSPIEHAQVADVAQELARAASAEFDEEISPSAVQGLLWYLEKHRYASLGAAESARESYHDAAVNNLFGRQQKPPAPRKSKKVPAGVALATALTSPQLLSATTGAATGAATAEEDEDVSEAAILGAAMGLGLGGRALLKNPGARQAIVNGISFVAPKAGPDALKPIQAFMRRNFTSTGDLPQEVFRSKIRNHGWIESQVRDVAYTIREFEKAAKEAWGGVEAMGDAEIKMVDDALKGAAPITTLPASLRPVVTQMRTHIDTMSRALIDEGVVQGPLAATIESGLGFYAKRSYRIFDDPDWAKNVPQDAKNRAIAYLRQEYPNASEEEIQGTLAELLFRAEDGPIAMMQKRKLGGKAMQALTARKDIHPAIRALWGEYGEAQINYAKSVASMSQLIGNHRILIDAKTAGKDKWLFDAPIVRDGEEYAHQIAADGSKAMAPLNGLYTSKAIADAFTGAFDSPMAGGFLRTYMKANGAVKVAKTVLSPQAQIRNLIGNMGFAIANGHVRGTKMLDAFKAVSADLGGNDYKQFQDRYKKYLNLGVVATGTTEGELRDIIKDASKQGVSYLTNPIMSTPSKLMAGSMKAYRAADDLWKIFAYENEVSRYRAAYPSWTNDQVEAKAAEIVRNTYPNYDMVPNAIKAIRRIPLVGTFTSFPAEVVRVGYHTLKQASDEIKDPATRSIGLQRAAGIMAAATVTTGAAITSRQLVGVTPDEEEDLRRFMAPWDKHAQFFHLGKDERGNRRFINMGYTDPYSYLREPVMALLSGDDWEGKLWEVGWMLAEPFLGEEILASRIVDVSRNKKKDTGSPVFNEQADLSTRFSDGLLYVAEAFEPGALTSGKRIASGVTGEQSESGRVYNLKDELLSVTTGQRRQAIDPRQGMRFKAREFQESMTEAQRIINRTLTDRSSISPQQIASAYAETEQARRRLFDNLHLDAQAALRLGLSRQEVYDLLSQGGISEAMAKKVIVGTYEPYRPSDQFLKSMQRSFRSAAATGEEVQEARGEVAERVGALRSEYNLARISGGEQ